MIWKGNDLTQFVSGHVLHNKDVITLYIHELHRLLLPKIYRVSRIINYQRRRHSRLVFVQVDINRTLCDLYVHIYTTVLKM